MILLDLFLTFLLIGAVSFGGGYGMISLVREQVLAHGWLTESEFLDMIAVSESTPGPLAVNMATFIGSSQAGFPGALVATLGVVLPAFLIILLIAAVLKNLLRYRGVEAFLSGVRPTVVGLILGTAVVLGLATLFSLGSLRDTSGVTHDAGAFLILFCLLALDAASRTWRGRAIAPILLILLSAVLGMLVYPHI
ncbi:MAG: chromate transporter [Eubacteriales bacterium]|nr:chromate transporter [Eubacteriales bacterium]